MVNKLRYAVIVAGGKGLRMGSETPKQFMRLGEQPILMHTLARFEQAGCQLVVVLPPTQQLVWQNLCNEYHFTLPHQVVAGGESRSQSVQNGLSWVPDDALVAVHDGVRPLVSVELIERTFQLAQEKGSAVPVVDVVDSLRLVENEQSHALDRSLYKAVQTPQTFQAHLLKQAYQCATPEATDDATLFERCFGSVCLLTGERQNIKITQPLDLQLAALLLNS